MFGVVTVDAWEICTREMHNKPTELKSHARSQRQDDGDGCQNSLPYSLAALTSWMEQGPQMTTSLSSLPSSAAAHAERAARMHCLALGVSSISSSRHAGGSSGRTSPMRVSSVLCAWHGANISETRKFSGANAGAASSSRELVHIKVLRYPAQKAWRKLALGAWRSTSFCDARLGGR
jgi:hypothetical protein